MTQINIEYTSVFSKNYEAFLDDYKLIVNQGGTRSSKTYSILQLLVYITTIKNNYRIVIVRKSLTDSKKTILKDFVNMLKINNLYQFFQHNKTTHTFINLDTNSTIEFIGGEEEAKLRGLATNILYINEVTELNYDSYLQLKMRCMGQMFIDFNPSDSRHFIFKELLEEDSSILIKSTYRDNPFLTAKQVETIENLIKADENYYKIYCLGECPVLREKIFNHFNIYDFSIYENQLDLIAYGIDFGYTHPTALVAVYYKDNIFYIKELLYKSDLNITQLKSEISNSNLKKDINIFADSARPDLIAEIRNMGYNVIEANKKVEEGLDFIRANQIVLDSNSENLINEYDNYKYKKDRNNNITDEIIKLNDDLMDAMRYALMGCKSVLFSNTESYIGIY